MNISQELKQSETKIAKLRFDLAVEEAVYERLRAIEGTEKEPALFRSEPLQTIPGSMPSHIERVLTDADKPMRIPAIIKAIKKRGVMGSNEKALANNVRGTLKRRTDLFERESRGLYKLKTKEQISTEVAQE